MRIGKVLGFGTVLLSLAALLLMTVFRQDIQDWRRLQGYTPPPEIVALAQDTTMLDSARRLFYIQHPQLTDKVTFNEHCRQNEQSIVLGCYVSNHGIYLLDVTDERLAGVKQVTAAHELLHAAYERLSDKERRQVDGWLQQVYDGLNDEHVKKTVELYREHDPSVVPNELHSIIGTEVRDLPVHLEEYYSRYFSDRLKIVAFSEQYEQAFIERRNQIRGYDEQLATLKGRIEGLQNDLASAHAELTGQRSHMNQLRRDGQIEAYNSEVPRYNARVNQYNRDIDRLQTLIAQYNDLVQQRNAIASEEAELVEAIDSRTAIPRQL